MSHWPVDLRYSSAFFAIARGSREYGLRVIGSTTSQISEIVVSSVAGSTTAVLTSGTISMSDSSIFWKPRMLEPSKPNPWIQMFSSTSATGTVKCCHKPGRSTNFMSTIWMLRSLISTASWSLFISLLQSSEKHVAPALAKTAHKLAIIKTRKPR